MRRRLKLFSLVLSGKCCGVRMPRTRAAPTTRTPLSPACGCASTLDYAVLYRTISGIRNNRGSMCAMSCGYTTILYVYPACLYGAILRRIDNSQNLRRHQTSKDQTACANEAKSRTVGSKPRVHARVVAIGSPPRYAPTGPPSGVCSNVEKARHAAGVERRHAHGLAARMHPLREPCRLDGAWMWATFIQRVPRSRSRISARPNSHFS